MNPYLILGGMALLAAPGYALSCWVWPFTRCGRCDGAGRYARSDGKVWRPCRRCGGSGKRLRVGRVVWNFFDARRRDAQ